MSTLNTAEIKEIETNTEYGFSFITFSLDVKGYTLQACCDGNGVVDKGDDGMLDGACGDSNEIAFSTFGFDECVTYFYENTDAEVMNE